MRSLNTYRRIARFAARHELLVSALVATAAVLVAAFRIALTYAHVSPVFDEPYHVLRGTHWTNGHAYVHTEHPPLGPAIFASVPSFIGVSYSDTGNKLADGNSVLYGNGNTVHTLALFRVGNLAFLLLCCGALFFWVSARRRPLIGAAAVVFLTLCPPILAHSGLATTDMPITATLLLAVVGLERALHSSSKMNWLLSGIAAGGALVSKFTAGLFLPISLGVLVLLVWIDRTKTPAIVTTLVLAASFFSGALFVVWAMYGFSVARLDTLRIDEYRFGGFPPSIARLAVPAPEYLAGIVWAREKIRTGHAHYFFGKRYGHGHPAFFPVVLAIKTPLAILLLALIGSGSLVSQFLRGRSTDTLAPLAIWLALLAGVLMSSVNVGVRHVLPLFPFIAVLAAEGLAASWRKCVGMRRSWQTLYWVLMLSLLGWITIDSIRSHPHYLSHFNELALGRPERIVIDSDLDWGQGLFELEKKCRELNIRSLKIDYFGTAPLDKFDLPITASQGQDPLWIAVSLFRLYLKPEYQELRDRRPDAVIRGGSIRLFRINPTE